MPTPHPTWDDPQANRQPLGLDHTPMPLFLLLLAVFALTVAAVLVTGFHAGPGPDRPVPATNELPPVGAPG